MVPISINVDPELKRPIAPNIPFEKHLREAALAFKDLYVNVQRKQGIPVLEARAIIAPLIEELEKNFNILNILQRGDEPSNYLYEHSVQLSLLAYLLAKWMNLPQKEWMQVALAGMLMDIGKTRLDPKIVWEAGRLTPEEFEEMKQHTVFGYEQLKSSAGLTQGVALAALQHHEREDGSGYPLGITGAKMHPYSKIVAVVDIYHAMCSDRLHQKAASPFLVIDKLLEYSFDKLDPKTVLVFATRLTRLSIGSQVELNSGKIGKVIFANPNFPTRPMIEVEGKMMDLTVVKDIWIENVIV